MWRRPLLCILLVIAPIWSAVGPASAQQAPEPALATALEAAKAALDQVEATLKGDGVTTETLIELRSAIVTAREELRAKLEEIAPRAAELEERLKQLGPPPAKDAAPEDPAIAAEREQLTQSFSQFDGALKQARLLATRADQLSERISERRRALYARELLHRGPSALDPYFWLEAADGLPGEWRSLNAVLNSWRATVADAGGVRILAALVLLLLILAVSILVTRWWLPRFDAGPRTDTRFARARTALWIFLWLAVRTPLALFAAFLVLDLFGLLPARVSAIADGLVVAVAVAAFGRGVARGLFAPDRPERRVIEIDARTAASLHDHLIWSTRIFGLIIFVQVVHKVLFMPVVLTAATNALFALAIAILLMHGVRSLRFSEGIGESEKRIPAPGGRLIAWVLGIAMVFALITGYSALAAFIALRVVVALAIFSALYLLLVATDALFTETLAPDTRRARSLGANLGISTQNVGLFATLLSAVIRVTLVLLAVVLILGPWELSTADLIDSFQNFPLALRIGEINISFRAILAALVILVVVLLVTRAIQRWMQREFLPRTSLEPSLQLSIATIFGYVGAITAVALAMGGLGVDLQKIALVAGALSVGIGFGLQAIVSNFVSGLILLAERPVRVGDSIVVKGEEGWVRRIRVRATEIETFERASVIIPNSELITGMVKNWTHANTLGRIIIKVGVGYDSDPDAVRDLLIATATEHAQIVQNPPPRAFLVAFGNSALEFELRCVVGNVENGLSVKSDLHFAILKRFRAVGIEIPYPQQEVRLRGNGEPPASPAPQDPAVLASPRGGAAL